MDIDGMFARHHSRVTSEKVKAAFRKLRDERRCTYFSPIGYLDEGSDKKVFDPERAPIIKRLFELYASGEWSLRDLLRWTRQQGLTTKPRRRRRERNEVLNGVEVEEKQGIPLCISTLQFILVNPFYVGLLRFDGDTIEGMHPPLIDMELFNAVQERLKEKCVTIKYINKAFFAYRDFFKC